MGQSRNLSKSWLLKSCFSFKLSHHGQQQLYLQYKVCWILHRIVGAPSFLQLFLRIQPPLQYPPEIHSSTSVNFQLLILLLLVQKMILIISTDTAFLYTSAIFHLPIFACSHPNNLHQKYFHYLSHLDNLGCVKRPRSYGVLWDLHYLISSSSKYEQW